jgi:hypothetical protein
LARAKGDLRLVAAREGIVESLLGYIDLLASNLVCGGHVMSIQEEYQKKAPECFIAAEGMADPARRLFLGHGAAA